MHCPARHLMCTTALCLSRGVCVYPQKSPALTPLVLPCLCSRTYLPLHSSAGKQLNPKCLMLSSPGSCSLLRPFLPLGSSCVLVLYPLCGAALSPHHKPSGQPCFHTTSPGKRPCPHIMCPLRKGPVSTPHPLRDGPVASKHPQRTAPATYNIPLWGTASDSCLYSTHSLRNHPVSTHGIPVR